MVKANGLLDQLQMTQKTGKHVTISGDVEDEGDCFRVGGEISEVSESDSEECSGGNIQVAIYWAVVWAIYRLQQLAL